MWRQGEQAGEVSRHETMGKKMSSALKKFVTATTSGSTMVDSYDKSPYPVEISSNGSVAVDPKTLVSSEQAKRQIAAVRELHSVAGKKK